MAGIVAVKPRGEVMQIGCQPVWLQRLRRADHQFGIEGQLLDQPDFVGRIERVEVVVWRGRYNISLCCLPEYATQACVGVLHVVDRVLVRG